MVNRIAPAMGPEGYKTYEMDMPLGTHWRPVSCEDYECDDFMHGFVLTVDTSTDLGKKQFHFVTHDKTRKMSMQRVGEYVFKFLYGPGNKCFKNVEGDPRRHKLPIGRPPFFLVSGGDWRGNPRGTPTMTHRRPEDWIDDFANHQDKLATAFQRG
jgi:hypothetical protein